METAADFEFEEISKELHTTDFPANMLPNYVATEPSNWEKHFQNMRITVKNAADIACRIYRALLPPEEKGFFDKYFEPDKKTKLNEFL